MTDKERIALGAIGGVLVGTVGYPLTGYESIAALQEGIYLAVGWAFRASLFALLGGLWAYLHRSENDRMKIFQLGLLGPAIVSAMINANVSKMEVAPEIDAALQLPSLISPAYAQSTNTPTPTRPQPAPWELIIRGLFGSSVVKDVKA
jgi:hypothetical protein